MLGQQGYRMILQDVGIEDETTHCACGYCEIQEVDEHHEQ